MELLEWLRQYWTILGTVVAIIVSWVRYEGKNREQDIAIQAMQLELRDIKLKQESNDKIVSKIEVSMAKIETSLEFILKKLDEK